MYRYARRLLFAGILGLFILCCSTARADFESHPLNRIEGRECTVALCCVFQNEAEWLREWIEFHKLIGITHFYLYNNLSTDNYLEVLQPYLLAGEVEIFDFAKTPLQIGDQPAIYNHATSLAQGGCQWIAAIDTDEFIVPLETKDLPTYLATFPDNIGSIEINWVTFGTSKIKRLKPGDLMVEKLILRAPINAGVNMWYKTIARLPAIDGWLNAHSCQLKPEFTSLRVTPGGISGIPEDDQAVSQIRIHHYIWRTEDFFYKVKLPRIKKWDQNHFHTTSPIDYLPVTNSVLDVTMLQFCPALREAFFAVPLINEELPDVPVPVPEKTLNLDLDHNLNLSEMCEKKD